MYITTHRLWWAAETDECQCGRGVKSVEHVHCSSDAPLIWIARAVSSSLQAQAARKADRWGDLSDCIGRLERWNATYSSWKGWEDLISAIVKLAIANLQPIDWVRQRRKRKAERAEEPSLQTQTRMVARSWEEEMQPPARCFCAPVPLPLEIRNPTLENRAQYNTYSLSRSLRRAGHPSYEPIPLACWLGPPGRRREVHTYVTYWNTERNSIFSFVSYVLNTHGAEP